jgi:hypothetical protein
MLKLESQLQGHPRIAKEMTKYFPCKTAKQIRNKRKDTLYKTLVQAYSTKNDETGCLSQTAEPSEHPHRPAETYTENEITDKGINRASEITPDTVDCPVLLLTPIPMKYTSPRYQMTMTRTFGPTILANVPEQYSIKRSKIHQMIASQPSSSNSITTLRLSCRKQEMGMGSHHRIPSTLSIVCWNCIFCEVPNTRKQIMQGTNTGNTHTHKRAINEINTITV